MSPLTFLVWLALVAGAGWTAFPLARRAFGADLPDAGWAVGRILFLGAWTMLAFWLEHAGLSVAQCAWLYAPLAGLGIGVGWRDRDALKATWRCQRRAIIATEAIFVAVFLGFFLLRGFWSDTSSDNGEKGMDSALIGSLIRAERLPPPNPYAAGARLRAYYYFGPLQTALLTRAAGTQLRWSYNLMCATLPALCFAALFPLGAALTGSSRGGAWVTGAVLCGGTLQPLYQWTHPDIYSPGRWLGLDPFAVSRIIPYTINEFPWFTFNQGDLHGHFFDFPFQIALMTLGWVLIRAKRPIIALIAALLCGATILTNTWDFPAFALLSALSILIVSPTRQNAPWPEQSASETNAQNANAQNANASASGTDETKNANASNAKASASKANKEKKAGRSSERASASVSAVNVEKKAGKNASKNGGDNVGNARMSGDSASGDNADGARMSVALRLVLAAGVLVVALLVAAPFLLHLQSAANPPQRLAQPASPLREWLMLWAPIALCWWTFAGFVVFERNLTWRATLALMAVGVGVGALFNAWQAPSVLVLPIIIASAGFAVAGLFHRSAAVRYACVLTLCGLFALAWSELTWAGFLGNPDPVGANDFERQNTVFGFGLPGWILWITEGAVGVDDFKRQDTVFKFGLQTWMLWGTAGAAGLWMVAQRASRALRGAMVAVLVPLALVMLAGNLAFTLHRVRFGAMREAYKVGDKNWLRFDAWDGWAHLAPPERAAAGWLERNCARNENLVEAENLEGGDFSQYGRYAAATGIPTIAGPLAHTFYWAPANAPMGRGENARAHKSDAEWAEVRQRKADARRIYAPLPAQERAQILRSYGVRYIVWGELERREYGEGAYADIARNLPVAAQFGAPDDPHRVVILRAN